MTGEISILSMSRFGAEITCEKGEFLLWQEGGDWHVKGTNDEPLYKWIAGRRIEWPEALKRALLEIEKLP